LTFNTDAAISNEIQAKQEAKEAGGQPAPTPEMEPTLSPNSPRWIQARLPESLAEATATPEPKPPSPEPNGGGTTLGM
jgi:hypothetical protein